MLVASDGEAISEDLGNVERSFIAITSKSTLTWSNRCAKKEKLTRNNYTKNIIINNAMVENQKSLMV